MRRELWAYLLVIGWMGCTHWQGPTHQSPVRLPTANLRSTSVGLEVATVTLQPNQLQLVEQIFAQLDEQVIPAEKRSQLVQYGLRAGLLGVRIPEPIQLLLLEATDRRRHPTAENQAIGDELRFVQCRAEKQKTIDIWRSRDLTFRQPTGEVLQLLAANARFQLFGWPDEQGASIRLVPEFAHGPLKQQYVSQDLHFHLEARQENLTFDEIPIEMSLRPGDVFLVTCNNWPKQSLGKALFQHEQKQKLILIRLAQTRVEGLFEEHAAE